MATRAVENISIYQVYASTIVFEEWQEVSSLQSLALKRADHPLEVIAQASRTMERLPNKESKPRGRKNRTTKSSAEPLGRSRPRSEADEFFIPPPTIPAGDPPAATSVDEGNIADEENPVEENRGTETTN
ncbi:hypothetical protein B7494_g3438 [Chlorociboria aeruginascens]|nr:hypothetical protein B7494_g3438 [Chlorociboria aeruginascens]